MKCECGKEITEDELKAQFNINYLIKMCKKCMNEFCNHAITGE